MSKIVISGVTGVGIKEYIKCRERFSYPVVLDSFPDFSSNPMWMGMDNLKLIAHIVKNMKKLKPRHIHHRWVYDVLVFEAIKCIRGGHDMAVVQSLLGHFCKAVRFDDVKHIVVLWQGSDAKLVEKMSKRANGLDWLSVEYVMLQNRLFEVVGKALGAHFVTHSGSWIDFHSDLDKIIERELKWFGVKPRPQQTLQIAIGCVHRNVIARYFTSRHNHGVASLPLELAAINNRMKVKTFVPEACVEIIRSNKIDDLKSLHLDDRILQSLEDVLVDQDAEDVKKTMLEMRSRIKFRHSCYTVVFWAPGRDAHTNKPNTALDELHVVCFTYNSSWSANNIYSIQLQ